MANGETKARVAAERKNKKHFHGEFCNTSFWITKGGVQIKNPATKRKSPWKGCNTSNKRANTRQAVDLVAA